MRRGQGNRWQTAWCAGVLTLALTTPVFAQNTAQNTAQHTNADALRAQQQSVQRDQEALRARIATLQKQIDAREAARKDATDALRASERTLSTLTRQLTRLKQNVAEANKRLAALQADIATQTQALAARRAALAEQLRAQYASGMTSPWAALLAGENPQALGRELVYLDYVSRARADEAQALNQLIAQLDTLHGQAREQRAALERLHLDTSKRQAEQQTQQRAHATLVARLDGQLKAQRAESDRLARDDARLGQLLTGLAQQLEALRREAEQAATRASQLPELPARLPMPVAGRIVARFGSAQPGGGTWRGVVIKAPADTPVNAVAAGTVVYADWLRGFGNLLIIDHGAELLTVYAYNQSLLKEVGDAVAAGEAVATVGATGGQVESGLYFEIRREGAPLDPAQFFAR